MAPSKTSGQPLLHCSFCGKSQKDVAKLIAGPGVYICGECVDLCNDIIAEETGAKAFASDWSERSEAELIEMMVRMHKSHDSVDIGVQQVVRAVRERGVSWARIGEALGMTRQSAWERFSGEE